MILLPSLIDRPISPDVSFSNLFLIRNCARWISPYSSGPSIVTVHSIAASLKSAIFMKRSWLRFPIPCHPRVFAAFCLTPKCQPTDTHDDMINLDDPSEYEDPVSQRAMAFCHVAKLADTVQDEAVKELCLTMLRKLNASVRTPSTADLRSIEGGHKK